MCLVKASWNLKLNILQQAWPVWSKQTVVQDDQCLIQLALNMSGLPMLQKTVSLVNLTFPEY